MKVESQKICHHFEYISGPTTNTSDTGITYDGNRAKDAIVDWIATQVVFFSIS